MDPQPVAGSPLWEGHQPSAGRVEFFECDEGAGISQGAASVFRFAANGVPPPVDPAVLALQAYHLIPIPNPAMHFGPDAEHIAVRLWLYLWTDDPGPISRTATAGAVSVTATATLQSVVWSMGAPVSVTQLDQPSAAVTCQGAGSPPPANVDTSVDPRPAGYCAYMYEVRSTSDRTGGSGTWPVTATATWQITWVETAGGNATGTITAPPFESATAVCVGAWSTVMVAQGYNPRVGTCTGR